MKHAWLLFLPLLLLHRPLPAEDWLQFRGPGMSAVAPQSILPTQLDTNQNLTWKIPLPGRGLSSPVILGDRLFLTCASGPAQRDLHIICLNAVTGARIWERQFWAIGRTMCHPKTCVAAPTPACDGQRLFALFSSSDLLCLDLEGNLLWLRGLALDYPNASNSLGLASSLAVADGTLIIQLETDAQALALGLDTLTGLNRWKLDRPKAANWSSPLVTTLPSQPGPVVALQSSAGLDICHPATGTLLWSYTNGASTIASSAVANGVFYMPSHGLTAWKPHSSGADQLWRSGQLRPGMASPVVVDGRVYVINTAGILNCGDLKDGKRLWQLRLQGPISATPVAAAAHLYTINEKGLLQVVDLSSAGEGRVVSTLDLAEPILSTPAISQNALFIRSDAFLYKFSEPPGS